ncbi:Lhr family helicase [Haliangium sp.]|uniref:Lhr family helicase n=1 Tax=Haliangium sp. TaxID=2663208 RepID=UPI003D136D91
MTRSPSPAATSGDGLARFGPATARWFTETFADPTPVQTAGWANIARGGHSLLIAPTGSGKTLAAFLWCIDQLIRHGRSHGDDPAQSPGVDVLYVSPLKALVYDVERNLRDPLRGIARLAEHTQAQVVLPQVGIRTGDTSPRERERLRKRPPHILVTTPESLYLMLGSRARDTLRRVRTVIVDEVHALAPTKRGAHLALSLERLCALCPREPQRIGLSATARPLQTVARFLGGDRPVDIVDAGARPALDLQIVVPVPDMTQPDPAAVSGPGPDSAAAPSPSATPPQERAETGERGLWPTIYPRLIELIRRHRSTILFVNSRGLCERLTQRINDLADEELCRSHHGSLSHDERRVIEDQLKAGHLRAIVATSSLELGIDMGTVDLVVLVESPGAVARGLQRVGRAGHGVGHVSIGRIFPKHRGDLLEATVVAQRMSAGEIEAIAVPESPLDVLAQHIVAAVAVEDWPVAALRAVIARAANYLGLPDSAFEAVLDMLSGRYPSHALAELRPRIVWDRDRDLLSARRGSKMLALISGGTIPDRGTYGVYLGEAGVRVGELDEEMVHEIIPGQVFTLGASSWRVEHINRDRVIVSPAPGEAGMLPFWRGEGPGRPVELGRAVGAFVREIIALPAAAAQRRLMSEYHLDELAAHNLLTYLDQQVQATGTPPTDRAIVIERFRDELGDWRVCILSPFGARVHAPWALAVEAALARRAGYEVQTMWSDDGIALRLADADELPPAALFVPDPDQVEALVIEQLGASALFAGQFRENAARALLLPRPHPGRRTPLWVQRLKSQELLAVARQFPSFPIVMETYRSCLKDVFDMPSLCELLRGVRARTVRVVEAQTSAPSPFARSLAFAYVSAYLYDGDAPLAERRAQALALDRELLSELLGQDELRELLDADVIAALERELQALEPDRRARHPDGLHTLLRRLGDLSLSDIAARTAPDVHALGPLEQAGRALRVRVGGEERVIAVEDAGLYRDALGCALPPGVPDAFLDPVADALQVLALRHSRCHGPFTSDTLAQRYGLPIGVVDATLTALATAEQVAAGAFRPDGHGREWCGVEVLRRIKRRTLAVLRSEVAPVDPSLLGRFLPRWHGVGDDAGGPQRLREVIVQLEGLPVPYSELERSILPARVRDFRPAMLDELGALGWLCWVGHGALGRRDGKIALYRRDQVAYLLDPPAPPDTLSPVAAQILAYLDQHGASFFVAMQTACDDATLDDQVSAVRELMWAGLITNDTFAPLRSNASVRAGATGTLPSSGRGNSRGRTRALLQAVGGRWSRTQELLVTTPASTERAHRRALTLLERHGVVCREVNELEPASGGFSALYPLLRELEEVGKVRRGYFVEGVGGAQFALPGAVDRLRSTRREDDDTVLLSAVDPANPYGWFLPWPNPDGDGDGDDGKAAQPRRVTGAYVVLHGGEPVVYLAPGGKNLTTFPAAAEPEVFVAAMRALSGLLARSRRRFLRIERIDGARPGRTAFADGLRAAGFHEAPNGFERDPD